MAYEYGLYGVYIKVPDQTWLRLKGKLTWLVSQTKPFILVFWGSRNQQLAWPAVCFCRYAAEQLIPSSWYSSPPLKPTRLVILAFIYLG